MTIQVDTDEVQRRIKELYQIDLTAEQINEWLVEGLLELSEAILAVQEADSKAMLGWAVDIVTGDVRMLLTPEQEEARERLRSVAKENMQRLVNRHRTGRPGGKTTT